MDLFDVAKACARRWYVFLLLMAVAAFAAYNAYSKVEPIYYGSATIGLSPPSVSQASSNPNEVRSNALMNSGGILLLSNLVAMGLSDASVHEQVAAQGGSPDFKASVYAVPGGQLPIIVIESTLADPDLVSRTLELAKAQGESVLQGIQQNAGVPADQALRTYPIGTPSAPILGIPSRMRTTVSILVAGTGLAVVVTVIIDILMDRRKRRKINPESDFSSGGHASTRISGNTGVTENPRENGNAVQAEAPLHSPVKNI